MAERPVHWLGSSYNDLKMMPENVQDSFGYALHLAQQGKRHCRAKPFKVRGESGVVELVEDYDGDTYRAIYTVKYADAVYVLHCFQKKSTTGIKTSVQDVNIVISRLKRLKGILSKR